MKERRLATIYHLSLRMVALGILLSNVTVFDAQAFRGVSNKLGKSAPRLAFGNQRSALGSEKRGPKTRAPRPNAPSFPGSSPQVVSPFDTASLAAIKKCVCELKNITESGFEAICSKLEFIIELQQSDFDILCSKIDALSLSGLDVLLSEVDILVSVIDTLNVSVLENLVNVIIEVGSDVDLILSKVCDIQVETSLLPIINSNTDLVLCAVGSKTDFAFSDTALFTSLDGINSTEISIVSWLKTIMREIRGV